jgi:EmrB/QacA subfamily drug resistance transporter
MTNAIQNKLEYKWLVAAAFVFGIFMDLMDITIINVALPTLGRHFEAGNDSLEWVVTGYTLSLAIWIPASGWIGDRIGTKKTFLFALAMFSVASALCALAWNVESLIAFRVLQGVGGGMMTPVGMAMLFRAFPPEERAQASVVIIIPTVVAPALGPVLGGLFVDYVSWHWIFLVNLPIGIMGFLFTWAFVKEEVQAKVDSFDWKGFALSASGLVLVLFALSRGPEAGWTSTQVLATGAIGVLTLIALVYVELTTPKPMLNLRLLTDRMFRTSNVVMFATSGGLMGVVFLLPLYLQNLRGYSAVDTGLILMPQAVVIAIMAPLAGKLYPKLGPKRMLAFAMLVFAASSGLLMLVTLNTSMLVIMGILLLRGVGMSFIFVPLQAASFATIKHEDTGQASSITNTNRQVATSFGVALLATVLVSRTSSHIAGAAAGVDAARHASLLGFHDAFFASLVLALVGFVFTLMVRDSDAAATMKDPNAAAALAEAGFAAEEPGHVHIERPVRPEPIPAFDSD